MSKTIEIGSFVTLRAFEPKETVWGRLLDLSNAGITIRCIDLQSLEIFKYQFGHEEKEVFPQTVFFPMWRVEKLYLDENVGEIPSVIDALMAITKLEPSQIIDE